MAVADFRAIDWFPVLLSLRVAFLATLFAAVLGVPLAYGLAGGAFRRRGSSRR